MSRIAISFSRYGREHLFRAVAIVELLADHHDLLLILPDSAYAPALESLQKQDRVELFTIPRAQKLVGRAASKSEARCDDWSSFSLTENKVQRFSPDLLISGSDSVLPRIGKRLSIRCIRVDYEHILEDIDLATLPWSARFRLMLNNFAHRVSTAKVDQQIISSFHPYPARVIQRGARKVRYERVGVLLRKELQAVGCRESHLLVKVGAHNKPWINELTASQLPARIYGLGMDESQGTIQFRDSPQTFAQDLLSCAGVVTDVGSQLIGEALACGKPVLAIPNPNDYHQQMCALIVSRCNNTQTTLAPKLTADLLNRFYESIEPASAQSSLAPIANSEIKALIEVQLS